MQTGHWLPATGLPESQSMTRTGMPALPYEHGITIITLIPSRSITKVKGSEPCNRTYPSCLVTIMAYRPVTYLTPEGKSPQSPAWQYHASAKLPLGTCPETTPPGRTIWQP